MFFFELLVTNAQCIIRTEKYLDAGIILNYDDDDYSQGYAQRKEVFRALTKSDILQPFISDTDFNSSNVRVDVVVYKLYVFDIRYQKIFADSQLIDIEIKFDGVVPIYVNGYA